MRLIQVFNIITKPQGCEEPCKVKNVTIYGKFKIVFEQLRGSTQSNIIV